jgi:CrcB protein
MRTYLGIAFAGGLGACTRYALDGLVGRRVGGFPLGIMVVNVSGAFLAGFAFVLLTHRFGLPAWARSTITIGFLGGYTTFSALSLDTYTMLEGGAAGLALANALGTVAAGLLAVYLGVVLGRAIA